MLVEATALLRSQVLSFFQLALPSPLSSRRLLQTPLPKGACSWPEHDGPLAHSLFSVLPHLRAQLISLLLVVTSRLRASTTRVSLSCSPERLWARRVHGKSPFIATAICAKACALGLAGDMEGAEVAFPSALQEGKPSLPHPSPTVTNWKPRLRLGPQPHPPHFFASQNLRSLLLVTSCSTWAPHRQTE